MAAPSVPNYRAIAAQKAQQYGVPVQVFLSQIQQESGFNPNARSGAGAQGIAQFIPSTARAYGLTNPYDAVAALDAAARYDRDLLHRYGSIQRALSAYNSGRPDAYQDPHFAGGQTYNYVRSILGRGQLPPPPNSPVTPTLSSQSPAQSSQPRVDPKVLALLNQGNRLFGLSELPTSLGSAPSRQPTPGSPPPSGGTPAPPSVKGKQAINLASHMLGVPYVWGGESTKGFDCSGLLQYVWAKQGVQIPRTTYDQFKAGTPVNPNQLQAGDAVFFKGSDSKGGLPGHVGIYIGGGKYIEAPHTGANVRISSLANAKDFVGARRYA